MGKIKIKDIDKVTMIQYLKENDKLTREQPVFLAIWSILNFVCASAFVDEKVVWVVLLYTACIVIGILMYIFWKKTESAQKNNNLFEGIFSVTTVLGCGVFSYLLLRNIFTYRSYRIVVLFIILITFTGTVTFINFKKDLKYNRSGSGMEVAIALIPSLVSPVVLAMNVSDERINPYLFFGLLLGMVTVVGATHISYFVKAYCYHLLEEDEKKSIIPEDAIILVESTGCHYCEQARVWLKEHEVTYVSRNIAEEKVRVPEIKNWHEKSKLSISRFLNVHSIPYKSMRLKDRLPAMADEEVYWAMAKNELLIKKPLLVSKDFVLVGFKDYEWEEKLIKK